MLSNTAGYLLRSRASSVCGASLAVPGSRVVVCGTRDLEPGTRNWFALRSWFLELDTAGSEPGTDSAPPPLAQRGNFF